MNKKNTSTRRKALKSIVIGSGVVVAGKSMPESWSKPVIDAVLLPAHAQTTTAEDAGSLGTDTPVEPVKPTYTIDCASLDVAPGKFCGLKEVVFSVSGSVSASDGSSLEGVELTVAYTNQAAQVTGAPGGDQTIAFSVVVDSGNVFATTELNASPAPSVWVDTTGTIVVSFTDPVYGPSSCTQAYTCVDIDR